MIDKNTKLKQQHDFGDAKPIGYWVEAKVISGGWTEPVSKQRQIENLTELFTKLLIHTANKEKDPVNFISEFLGENFKIWH